jgi:hypothetical protein
MIGTMILLFAMVNTPKDTVGSRCSVKYTTALAGTATINGVTLRQARGVELQRNDASGTVRVLGCNSMTSTNGYWDHSEPPALIVNSGDTVEIETGTHYMGRMVTGATFK